MTPAAALIIGFVLMAGGCVFLFANLRFVRRSTLVTATLVGYREERSTSNDDGASVYFYPQFEFRTATGQLVRAEPNSAEGDQPWPVGSGVAIRYLPDRPDKVRPDGARFVLVLPLALVLVGGFFVVLALLQ